MYNGYRYKVDLKLIEKLMAAMNRNGMKKIVFKEEGFEIELEKETQPVYAMGTLAFPPMPSGPMISTAAHQILPQAASVEAPSLEAKKEDFITSPMVGTFYSAASPDAKPFIKVGDTVEENTVVCILEAMKVMNEIKAGKKGTIAEILHKNGDPIEFGTKLFKLV